jgi:hypothetical protein
VLEACQILHMALRFKSSTLHPESSTFIMTLRSKASTSTLDPRPSTLNPHHGAMVETQMRACAHGTGEDGGKWRDGPGC